MDFSYTERNEVVKYLFFRRCYPLSQAKANDALFASCSSNRKPTVTQYLLRVGTNAEKERHGYPMLHWALRGDHEPGVKILLSCGANPNITKQGGGATALMVTSS